MRRVREWRLRVREVWGRARCCRCSCPSSGDQSDQESPPNSELSPALHLLLKDYENAAQLTYHIDGLRDRVTVFFVTVAGIAAAGLSVVLKDESRSLLA